MSTTTEVDELHQLIKGLRQCVTSLVSRHGDCPAMRPGLARPAGPGATCVRRRCHLRASAVW